jgi:hypothetical protein
MLHRSRHGGGVHTASPEDDAAAVSALAAILKLDADGAGRLINGASARITESRLLPAAVTLAGLLADHAGQTLTVSATCLLGHCHVPGRCKEVSCGHTCHNQEVRRVLPGLRQWHDA